MNDWPDEVPLDRCAFEEATVLFADVRGFTALAASLGPLETYRLLDRLYSTAQPVIERYGGRIDNFIGDAVMAVFSRPVDAARAGSELLGETRAMRGVDGSRIEIGVGMQHGPVMAGLLGSGEATQRTVIGDVVNVASRMEGLTRTYGVDLLAGPGVGLGQGLGEDARFIDWTRVKGRKNPVGVYEVLTADPPDVRAGKRRWRRMFGRGIALFHTARREEAAEVFEEYAGKVPDDPVCANYLRRSRSLQATVAGMTRRFAFDESMKIGVAQLDEQHEELFARAEVLRRALQRGIGVRADLEETVVFLADYVRQHFADEDRLMRQVGFPQLERQRSEHRACVEHVGALVRDVADDACDALDSAFRVWSFSVDWMTDHILGSDGEVGRFILDRDENAMTR